MTAAPDPGNPAAAPHSVAEANLAFAATLVDEWARAGVRVAALSPGSRSAPLALALARDGRIRLEVFLDERSASFFALGAAKASGRATVVLCTSGTAAAHLHPAVAEAHHARAPLIVCTADRPPDLRDTGAGQAIDQLKLFGDAVRWFADPGAPGTEPAARSWWRSLASRAVGEAEGRPPGPVHLNLPFREPLVPDGERRSPAAPIPEGRPDSAPWTATVREERPPSPGEVASLVSAVAGRRGVVLAGWGATATPEVVHAFASACGWPVLADPLSGLRTGELAVSTYDPVLRSSPLAARLRPEVAVRLGAAPTNRAAAAWLETSVPQVLVDPEAAWLDPHRSASLRLAADPGPLLEAAARSVPGAADPAWLERWQAVDAAARACIDDLVDSWEVPFEGRVARDVVDAVPTGGTLVVGSSMPVRDVESFARPRSGLRFLANRGTNGIDGFVSTVLGVSAGGHGPVVALCGDLTFLHDAGGLLGTADRGLQATFVVVDNDGGGIFSFLPQSQLDPGTFEAVFGTPHGIDLGALSAVHRVPAATVTTAGGLVPALHAALEEGGVQVVLVRTGRADNVERHRRVWAAVAEAAADATDG